MAARGPEQRFVTALVQEDEPVEQGRCCEDLARSPGRGPRPKGQPDAGRRQCNASKDESGAAGVLRLKMPDSAGTGGRSGRPGRSFPKWRRTPATIRVRRSGSRERPLKKDEEG